MSSQSNHIPILVEEVLSFFEGAPLRTFFEGTVGAGGHALAILEAHPEIKRYIACDQDPDALEIAKKRLESFAEKVTFVKGNFRDLDQIIEEQGLDQVDGFFFDFGVSSMQLDRGEKGFSFLREGPLDMRMDPEGDLKAEDIVNRWPEKELGTLFRDLGQEPRWKRAAKAIVDARRKMPIKTTEKLAQVLVQELKTPLRGKLHPATLVFQALRMCVNQELDSIREGVQKAVTLLSSGGRIGTLSFHSLEDGIVKSIFKQASFVPKRPTAETRDPSLKLLIKKPCVPGKEEIRKNPRARSAKLRFAERCKGA